MKYDTYIKIENLDARYLFEMGHELDVLVNLIKADDEHYIASVKELIDVLINAEDEIEELRLEIKHLKEQEEDDEEAYREREVFGE